MGSDTEQGEMATSLVDALLVYAEPLAANAHAVVIGDSEGPVAARLIELGARSVYVFDPDPARAASVARDVPRGVLVRPFVDDLDVRDGAFDLAVIPDLADLNDPRRAIERLRSAVASNGALIALGRARVADAVAPPFSGRLGQAALPYDELYDLFAAQFEEVTLAGVVPFTGVVFAQLGGDSDEPAVSVDTRLVSPDPPSVFVVVASQERERRAELDPYAIIQIDERSDDLSRGKQHALEAIMAAAQLKSDLLTTQVEELRDRLVVADVRTVEIAARLERAALERDGALTRAMELEAVLGAAQQSLAAIERTLLEAERGMLERDDRLAQLSAELDARRSASSELTDLVFRAERAEAALSIAQEEMSQRLTSQPTDVDVRIEDVAELLGRAERAETELAHLSDGHASETAKYEHQLRDRARFIAALEKELVRREHLVRELVASVEEQNAGAGSEHVFESAPPMTFRSMPPAPPPEEVLALKQKLDDLAVEIARREGELVARGWRITELENLVQNTKSAVAAPAAPPAPVAQATSGGDGRALSDELAVLRQALAQEHAARVRAESGEELAHARAEVARQAVLLEQIRAQRETS